MATDTTATAAARFCRGVQRSGVPRPAEPACISISLVSRAPWRPSAPGKWPPRDASRGDARAREGALMTTQTGHQPPRRSSACPRPDCGHVGFRVTITPITPPTRPCAEYTATTLTECAGGAHQVHAGHGHAHGEGCGHLGVPHVITPTTTDRHRHASHEGHRDDHRPARPLPAYQPACEQIGMAAGRPQPTPEAGSWPVSGKWARTTSRPVQHSAVWPIAYGPRRPHGLGKSAPPTDHPACSWPPAEARRNGRYGRYWRYLHLITHKRRIGDPAPVVREPSRRAL